MQESEIKIPVEMTMFRKNGVFRTQFSDGVKVVGVSAHCWEDYLETLLSVTDKDGLIVSPELMTATGELSNISAQRELVENRLGQLLDISKTKPRACFLLGTPVFVSCHKPRNSALLIKNGEIVGITNKRAGVMAEENEEFEMMPEERPFLLPGTKTAILICADMPTATIFSRKMNGEDRDRTLFLLGRQSLIGKTVNLISDEATSLVVMSCWAVGSQMKILEDQSDSYYGMQLRNIAWNLMATTNIKEIAVVDRLPGVGGSFAGPFNSVVRWK